MFLALDANSRFYNTHQQSQICVQRAQPLITEVKLRGHYLDVCSYLQIDVCILPRDFNVEVGCVFCTVAEQVFRHCTKL